MGNSQCCTAERGSNGIQQNQPLTDETIVKHANRLDYLLASPEIVRAQSILTIRDYEFLYSTLIEHDNTDADVLGTSELYQMLALLFATSAYSVPQCLCLDILSLFPIVSDNMHHVIVDKYREIYGKQEDVVNIKDFQNQEELSSVTFSDFGNVPKVRKDLITSMQMQEFRWSMFNSETKVACFQVLAEAACAQHVAEKNLREQYKTERPIKVNSVGIEEPVITKLKPAPLSIPESVTDESIRSPVILDAAVVLSEEFLSVHSQREESSIYSPNDTLVLDTVVIPTEGKMLAMTSPLTALSLDDSDEEIKIDGGSLSVDRRTKGRYKFSVRSPSRGSGRESRRESPSRGKESRGDSPPPRTRSPSAKGMERGKWFEAVKDGVQALVRVATEVVAVKRFAPASPNTLEEKIRVELQRDWMLSSTYIDQFKLLLPNAEKLLQKKTNSSIKAALSKRPTEFPPPPAMPKIVLLETFLPSQPNYTPLLTSRSDTLHQQIVSTLRRFVVAAGQQFCRHTCSCAVHTRSSASRPASPTNSVIMRKLPVNCTIFAQELEAFVRKAVKRVFMMQLEYAVETHTFPLYNELLLSSQLVCVAPNPYTPPIVMTTNVMATPPPLFPSSHSNNAHNTPRSQPINLNASMLKWSDWRTAPEVQSHMRTTTANNQVASAITTKLYLETGSTKPVETPYFTSNTNSNNLKLQYVVEREFTNLITILQSSSAPEYIRMMMHQTSKKEPFAPMLPTKAPTPWGVLWLFCTEPFQPKEQMNPVFVPSYQIAYSRSQHYTVLNKGDCFSQADVADGRVWLMPRDTNVCFHCGVQQPTTIRHDMPDLCTCSQTRLIIGTEDGPLQYITGVLSGKKGGLDMSPLTPYEDTSLFETHVAGRKSTPKEVVTQDQLMYSIQCLDGRMLEHQVLDACVVYKY